MSPRLPQPKASLPQRNAGTWLAMVIVLGVAGGLLSLIAMVFPDVLGLIAVLGGFCGFVAIHYFTWGRWLMRHASAASTTSDVGRAEAPPVDDEAL